MKNLFATIVAAAGLVAGASAATIDLSAVSHSTTAKDGDVVTGALSGFGWKISIADGATVTLSNVYIVTNNVIDAEYKWGGISCLGDATIILDGDNTVHGIGPDYPGIHVLEGKTLTIDGSGSLTAVGNKAAAGIGGGAGEYCYGWMTDLKPATCGSVVINGGTINAIGGSARDTNYSNMSFGAGGAGIGSGYFCNGGTVVVNGGTITATGGICAAGIGTGTQAKSGDITINGGDVTACGGDCAAGIGSGTLGNASNIVINCGTVSAIGGYGSLIQSPGYEDNIFGGGAGIGSGYFSSCGDIAINGGIVTATGTNCGAGIGSGGFTQICANWHGDCKCGLITIRGGRIVATGGESAAGIGGGAGIYNITGSISEWNRHDSVCSGIIISGGDIKATGGDMAAGIGSGEMRSNYGSITFLAKCGPRVKATQGWGYGEPIGHGYSIKPELCDSGPISMAPSLDVRTGNSTYTVKWNGDLNYITDDITVYGDDPDLGKQILTGIAAGRWKFSIADGATVTISNATLNSGVNDINYEWAGITCEGNATIVLKGDNIVKGWYKDYPGIHVPYGKTLTIMGDGFLAASSNGRAAGIGGGYNLDCGNIDIKGGGIVATGGEYAAGIGGGGNADCGNIFIRSGILKVVSTCGEGDGKPIGRGDGGGGGGVSVASGLEDTTVGKTRTFTPDISAATYTLTFDPDGGTLQGGNFGSANGTTGAATVKPTMGKSSYQSIGTAVKSGKIFVGWYTDDGEMIYDANGRAVKSSCWSADYNAATWQYSGAVALKARWAAEGDQVPVTFSPAGGTLQGGNFGSSNGKTSAATVNLAVGKTSYQSIGTAAKSGWLFAGWFTDSGVQVFDANGRAVYGTFWNAPFGTAKWQYADAVTLYAAYAKADDPSVLTCYANGGKLAGGNFGTRSNTAGPGQVTMKFWRSNYQSLGRAAKGGYAFAGWWTEANGGVRVFDINGLAMESPYWSAPYGLFARWQYAGDLSLYARWVTAGSQFTVTCNPNGGKLAGGNFGEANGKAQSVSVKMTFAKSSYQTLGKATKTGSLFAGWWTALNGGKEVFDAQGRAALEGGYWSDVHPAALWQHMGGATLYARWATSGAQYTLTCNPNGGKLSGGNFGEANGKAQSGSVKVAFGKANYRGLGVATKSGFKFDGWYTIDGVQVFDADGRAVQSPYWSADYASATWQYPGNVTVYANWTK